MIERLFIMTKILSIYKISDLYLSVFLITGMRPQGAYKRKRKIFYLFFEETVIPQDMPILFTEGEKKTAKAVKEGFMAIGLLGVWNFKSSDNDFLLQLENLKLKHQKCFVPSSKTLLYGF